MYLCSKQAPANTKILNTWCCSFKVTNLLPVFCQKFCELSWLIAWLSQCSLYGQGTEAPSEPVILSLFISVSQFWYPSPESNHDLFLPWNCFFYLMYGSFVYERCHLYYTWVLMQWCLKLSCAHRIYCFQKTFSNLCFTYTSLK